MRKAVETKLIESGLSLETRTAALESAVASARSQIPVGSTAQRNATAIPHELGHMWLIQNYWPGISKSSEPGYGGPGPDWLDEMAAVIVEPNSAKDRRRGLFWERYAKIMASQAANSGNEDSLLSLTEFFSMAHPLSAAAQNLADKGLAGTAQGGMVVRVLSGDAAQAFGGDGIRFYLQSLLVSDYMKEMSSAPDLFDNVATSVAAGASFDKWLSDHGVRYGLAESLREFEADWKKWLEKKRPKT